MRVIASTHRDLRADIAAGRFREDLYYRLAVVELLVPPLREHREDIPGLAAEFARRYAARFGAAAISLSPEGRPPGFREQVDAFERNLIAQALELARGNQS